MSKKKNKNKVSDGDKKTDGDNNNEPKQENNQKGGAGDGGGGGGGGKKDNSGGNAVVLKIDLHCDGCASKIGKYIRGFEGAEGVKVDGGSGKITVTGKVDPVKLREKLEEKTHKKVELLSPVPKKDKENAKAQNDDAAGDGKEEKEKGSKEKNKPKDNNNNNNNGSSSKKNKKDEKSSKEPPVTTAVLKVSLHCEGCIQKIHRIVSKTKGYQEMKVDKQKDLLTVKGAMDMKDLVENLKKHLKRNVEIVPPKKDEKKDKEGGGGGGGGGGAGEGKAAGGGGGGEAAGGGGGERMEGNKMQQQQQQVPFVPYGYGYPTPSPFVYGAPAYVGDPYQFHYHAPQMFSDENPNACTVM